MNLFNDDCLNAMKSIADNSVDNCMGSGSTGVACKNLNRNFIGIEKELTYFEIAKERINGSCNLFDKIV